MTVATGVDDAALAAAARGGDRDAFGRLYERHVARVAGVVCRRVPAADVDDVVQEAFVRAWQGLTGLDDHTRFGPWVRTIAVRVAADHARSRDVREVALTADLALVDTTLPDLEEAVSRRDAARRVVADLATLGPRDSQALWLRDALGTPIPQVAGELGMTEASTRVMLTRARRRLRQLLGVVASCLGALAAGRRSWMAASTAGTSVAAAAVGAYLVASVTGAPPGPPSSAPSGADARPARQPAAVAGDHPPVGGLEPEDAAVGPSPMSPVADAGTAADAGAAGPAVDAPPSSDPLPAPTVERRRMDDREADPDVQVGTPDDGVMVEVHDGELIDEALGHDPGIPLEDTVPGAGPSDRVLQGG